VIGKLVVSMRNVDFLGRILVDKPSERTDDLVARRIAQTGKLRIGKVEEMNALKWDTEVLCSREGFLFPDGDQVGSGGKRASTTLSVGEEGDYNPGAQPALEGDQSATTEGLIILVRSKDDGGG